jgi:penicillin amidase
LLSASLPTLDGIVSIADLSSSVRIERDSLGVPTIQADSRLDLAVAVGFLHGQERFFQMDLLRRHPAGELAALLGPAVVEEDRQMRRHRFRARARERIRTASAEERALLGAYARGVEAGRSVMRKPPWEYLVLGITPDPWTEEDTILVVYAMYHLLQGAGIAHERAQGLIEELLPPALGQFLSPAGSPWDAPMLGSELTGSTIPAAKEIDLRKESARWMAPPAQVSEPSVRAGSNNWAVSGSRTAHRGAILANDMHLGLPVPNIWYRAAFRWHEGQTEHQAWGITLPGTPVLVVGSNAHLAWGFTNTEGDYADLIYLESDPARPDHYRTPDGPRPFTRHQETIRVNGGRDVTMQVEDTIWGPVFERDHKGRRLALRWVAHAPDAVNLELLKLETATAIDEALRTAQRAGAPGQNVVVADARGGIAWTILGKLPRRVGFDGTRPVSWADGSRRWVGWLPVEDYPHIVHPPEGILWTANNRVVADPGRSRIGLNNYDHGARAMQIRDGLRGRSNLRESDMLAVQLDDRALFLSRWQRLLIEVLQNTQADRHQALLREVRDWQGRATVESVGFRLVRRWRMMVTQTILRSLTAPCLRADRRFQVHHLNANVEESVWQLVSKRPAHLLPPGFSSWEALLVDAVDRVSREVQGKEKEFEPALAKWTWGSANRAQIRHPLSRALGPLTRWFQLDMPAEPLPGDSRGMPRIQMPSEGASQRSAVSPGREAEGYFHMPAGQSGHPWSPHYRNGHPAWVSGEASSFLPGVTQHRLELRP